VKAFRIRIQPARLVYILLICTLRSYRTLVSPSPSHHHGIRDRLRDRLWVRASRDREWNQGEKRSHGGRCLLWDVVLDLVLEGLDAKDAVVEVKAVELVVTLLVVVKVGLRVVGGLNGRRRRAGDDLEAIPAQQDVAGARLLRKHHRPGREALVVHRLRVEDKRRRPAAELTRNTQALSV
jgi:hypothetical protein